MQRDSKGVLALSSALFCAAAGCSTERLDLFDPSWPANVPLRDADSNRGTDATGSTDAPMAQEDALDAGGNGAHPDAVSADAPPRPANDANEPKDAPGPTTDEAGDGETAVDARVGVDAEMPGVDAGTVADAGPPCSGIVFRGHCYFAIARQEWDDAACASQGAHLVTITSADEQQMVATLGSGERWIGLRRPNNSPQRIASFAWVTNEPVGYANWSTSNGVQEPNFTGNCVRLLTNGTWADNDCTDSFVTLCERE